MVSNDLRKRVEELAERLESLEETVAELARQVRVLMGDVEGLTALLHHYHRVEGSYTSKPWYET